MNFNFDLSLNTLIMSGVILLAGWGLKAIAWAVIESIKAAVGSLIETKAKLEIVDAKMGELIKAVGDVEKLRSDVNLYYARLKKLEERFGRSQNCSDK